MPHILTTSDTGVDNPRHVDNTSAADLRTGYPNGLTPEHELSRVLAPSTKRKRVGDYTELEIEQPLQNEQGEDATGDITRSPPRKRKQISGIRLPSLVYPKSQYQDWHFPLPVSREKDVLAEYMVPACF